MRYFCLLLLLICFHIKAEIYKDFEPLITIAKIKSNYPNANFEIIKAAWVKENDRFIKISGEGLSGDIYVATEKTSEQEATKLIDEYKEKIKNNPDGDNTSYMHLIEAYESYLTYSDDEKYTIRWVRWVPIIPFPLERLVSKFGNPDKIDFNEDNFRPYGTWTRGVLANLSDDKKMVNSIEYTFTDDDYNKVFGGGKPSEAPAQKKSKGKAKAKK